MNKKQDDLLKNRITELANRSYQNNIYTFTEFLSIADESVFHEMETELRYIDYKLWGGAEGCERKILRFGSTNQLGYEEDFPITLLNIKPLMDKFADNLTHRDILGAIMNLGVQRSVLGDIFLEGNSAYVFCITNIAEYICDNLARIKHTSVLCKPNDGNAILKTSEKIEKIIQIQSERLDGIIAKAYNLSRSQVIPLFSEKKIFVNGRQMENNSYLVKTGDIITTRGYGRCEYAGAVGLSKKGKINAKIIM